MTNYEIHDRMMRECPHPPDEQVQMCGRCGAIWPLFNGPVPETSSSNKTYYLEFNDKEA